ncbi:hypothetical protein TCON_0189 [Astathelohania contejeani]|uniref:Uncharacterized protein n=1 Tax=Astathelohania contejeani TaxID=164912 RepID=A0ABQ7I2E0_9MICR|nr:hypothetical protein TCON_0189 [Thelohania contejeani]
MKNYYSGQIVKFNTPDGCDKVYIQINSREYIIKPDLYFIIPFCLTKNSCAINHVKSKFYSNQHLIIKYKKVVKKRLERGILQTQELEHDVIEINKEETIGMVNSKIISLIDEMEEFYDGKFVFIRIKHNKNRKIEMLNNPYDIINEKKDEMVYKIYPDLYKKELVYYFKIDGTFIQIPGNIKSNLNFKFQFFKSEKLKIENIFRENLFVKTKNEIKETNEIITILQTDECYINDYKLILPVEWKMFI